MVSVVRNILTRKSKRSTAPVSSSSSSSSCRFMDLPPNVILVFILGCFVGNVQHQIFTRCYELLFRAQNLPLEATQQQQQQQQHRQQQQQTSSSCSCVCDDPLLSPSSSSSPSPSSGWRTIQVFAGDTQMHLNDILKIRGDENRTQFAQVGQDQIVWQLLNHKRNGYFIDLAANDAVAISNSLGLEINANWSGLCMEPNPEFWYSLAYYRQCQVIAAVVGGNRTKIDFVYNHVGGGIRGDEFDNKQNGSIGLGQSRMQITVTLVEIFNLFHVPNVIDYFSLDVEGAEGLIMEQFPFETHTVSIFTVERPKESLQVLLKQHGYQFLKNISLWGESIWAHESVLPQLNMSALDVMHPDIWREEQTKEAERRRRGGGSGVSFIKKAIIRGERRRRQKNRTKTTTRKNITQPSIIMME